MVRSPADPLADWLQEQLGIALVASTPVGGGCIHSAWCLQGEGEVRLFAKSNRADQLPLLEAEADGLAALAEAAPPSLVIPRPLALGLAGEQAVLVLPWLDLGRGTARREAWEACGADLARLHRNSLQTLEKTSTTGAFGWHRDNFIGSSPQPNGWREDWATFFTECRLAPQLAWLTRKGTPMEGAERLLAGLPQWLASHSPEPCLVHGDLWSGNLALLAGGGGSLFDPAVYRGDREGDLAMARLFGGVPEAFFQGYGEEWPLPQGWRERGEAHQLYHLLNHANLFGGGYKKQAQAALLALLSLMKK